MSSEHPVRAKRRVKPISFKRFVAGGQLPNHIVPILNPDKKGLNSSWPDKVSKRNLVDFPIFRAALAGNPGSGKSTWLKDLIGRKTILGKPFKRIYVVAGSAYTHEWGDIPRVIISSDLPEEDELAKPNTLLILDDVDIKSLGKGDQELIPRLFKHFSSHFGLSIAITNQNFTDIPIPIRRACNVFVVYKTPDIAAAGKGIAQRVGIPIEKAQRMLSRLRDTHDHIVVDMIPNSPMPYRFNSFARINFKE